jgi:NAD(P)-dependent dehydrogenase (short-subunit alcohol dehydrogenase family)
MVFALNWPSIYHDSFHPHLPPSMSGTVIFTGPNGGMTSLTVKQYAENHPDDHLVLLVRNPAKLPAGVIPASDKVTYAAFDMTSLTAVRAAAKTIIGKVNSGALPRIKAVICSAAIQYTSVGQAITTDGYDETVAVNHLAHFVLVLDLLPVMSSDGRIVIVGSDSVSLTRKVWV